MMKFSSQFTLFFATLACIFSWIQPVHGQTISGIVTTSDQKKLLQAASTSSSFASGSGSADITIDETKVYQQMVGFGGSITDSAAKAMNDLKNADSDKYNSYLKETFTTKGAALNYLRVPIGASDFSYKSYSLDDTSGDTSFKSFKIDNAPSYLFSVLKDIVAVNKYAKIHILPWSPPAWMKDNNSMNGGSLKSGMIDAYPTYLLKAVQAFKAKNLPVVAISIQNEPENSNSNYPSCKMSASDMATIGKSLRSLLDKNDLKDIKVVGYEHNWDNAASYPVTVVQDAQDAFDAVAFHCYGGNVNETQQFHSKYPNKAMYLTECTGTTGSDFWTDMQWYVNNLFTAQNTATGMMWLLASADNGKATYPGSDSCGNGCRGVSTVTTSKVTPNQEYYTMAHYARAFISDDGSTLGKRIEVSGGDGLNVVGYVTGDRYSLVVMNANGAADKTISFQGRQVKYSFPTGLTTLWWTTSDSSSSNSNSKRMMKKRRV
ncbi:glycoside hydrolase family 30 protein [Collybiopsis luxurians FD-317 M1]|uniref:Glycoside hydrolase family 30 protein n=1 Tax=Collybiopsis luxurians FD-317 M1 TaxID=944289 RepID=A0A0D0CPW5_9AGAR|nr:glycoside hydrolase family 30 protein [Collybiopsis luxurians FD-317 M1]